MQKAIDTILTYIDETTVRTPVRVVIYTEPNSNLVLLVEGKDQLALNLEYIMPLVTNAYPQYFKEGHKTTWVKHVENTGSYCVINKSANGTVLHYIQSTTFELMIGKQDPNSCNHPHFECKASVFRHTPDGTDPDDPNVKPDSYSAEIRIYCMMCGVPFNFPGLMMGSGGGPKVNADATELRLKIRPGAMDPICITQTKSGETNVALN